MTNEKLRAICIENDFFTSGCTSQYEKMFVMYGDGDGILSDRDLAIMIFTASEHTTIAIVEEAIRVANLDPISLGRLEDDLVGCGWGSWEIDQIITAMRASSGTGYVAV